MRTHLKIDLTGGRCLPQSYAIDYDPDDGDYCIEHVYFGGVDIEETLSDDAIELIVKALKVLDDEDEMEALIMRAMA